MAREYAQIKLAIWADDDWRALSPGARYLYLTLLTSPTLTHCGTADWRPARIAALNGKPVSLMTRLVDCAPAAKRLAQDTLFGGVA